MRRSRLFMLSMLDFFLHFLSEADGPLGYVSFACAPSDPRYLYQLLSSVMFTTPAFFSLSITVYTSL